MDNKKEIKNNLPEESNNTFYKGNSFIFNENEFGLYVFNRTERLSIAVHLLCSVISDSESIKDRLKELSLQLVSLSLSLRCDYGKTESTLKDIVSLLAEMYLIFDITKITRNLSEMNCELIKSEIKKVTNFIVERKENFVGISPIFSESFFSNQTIIPNSNSFLINERQNQQVGVRDQYKGQKDIRDNNVLYINKNGNKKFNKTKSVDKNKRQEVILKMLDGGVSLTVKDFSKEISDCSEKTIQRELLALVGNGVLKKEGERRWSRYTKI